ncbi:MAG: hypothetical protein ACRDKT_12265 [Actinomycetota bacterium]
MERQVMERRDQDEQTAVARPPRPPRRRPTRQDGGPSRRILVVALILAVIAFVALGIAILNAGEEPIERADAPEQWDSINPGKGTPLDLGAGRRAATVIISAQDGVCWSGYVGSAEVEGCGEKQIDVTGAPAVLGANVRHTETTKAFIGIAMWSDNGNQRLIGDTTRKKLGLVSITGYPPKPQG